MGRCLICLFYWGTVLNIYFRIPDGGLASWFWASSSNTLSSVYRGLLGDYCSAVTVSPYGRRSTKDHLPQEQELGAAFTRMFMARILPLSLGSVLFSTTTHRQACSVYSYRTQTGSLCFRLICYKMSVLIVCLLVRFETRVTSTVSEHLVLTMGWGYKSVSGPVPKSVSGSGSNKGGSSYANGSYSYKNPVNSNV